jgi:hypothetical protein
MSGPPGGVPPDSARGLIGLGPLVGGMPGGMIGGAPRPASVTAAASAAALHVGGLAALHGGASPGAGAPLELPDLQRATVAALENVIRRAEAAPAAEALPPPPQPGYGATPPPPPPGVWRAAPAAPAPTARAPIESSGWPAAERDLAQRIGDGLDSLIVARLRRRGTTGWIAIVALFGITVPIILLRQSFDVRLRIVLSALTFLFWLGLVQDLG